jgi:hypothetical protein
MLLSDDLTIKTQKSQFELFLNDIVMDLKRYKP